MPKTEHRILILRNGLQRDTAQWREAVEGIGAKPVFCLSPTEITNLCEKEDSAIAVCTHKPPSADAISVIKDIRLKNAKIPIMVILDKPDEKAADQLAEAGADIVADADLPMGKLSEWMSNQLPQAPSKPRGLFATLSRLFGKNKSLIAASKKKLLKKELPHVVVDSKSKKSGSPVEFSDSFTPLKSARPTTAQEEKSPPSPLKDSASIKEKVAPKGIEKDSLRSSPKAAQEESSLKHSLEKKSPSTSHKAPSDRIHISPPVKEVEKADALQQDERAAHKKVPLRNQNESPSPVSAEAHTVHSKLLELPEHQKTQKQTPSSWKQQIQGKQALQPPALTEPYLACSSISQSFPQGKATLSNDLPKSLDTLRSPPQDATEESNAKHSLEKESPISSHKTPSDRIHISPPVGKFQKVDILQENQRATYQVLPLRNQNESPSPVSTEAHTVHSKLLELPEHQKKQKQTPSSWKQQIQGKQALQPPALTEPYLACSSISQSFPQDKTTLPHDFPEILPYLNIPQKKETTTLRDTTSLSSPHAARLQRSPDKELKQEKQLQVFENSSPNKQTSKQVSPRLVARFPLDNRLSPPFCTLEPIDEPREPFLCADLKLSNNYDSLSLSPITTANPSDSASLKPVDLSEYCYHRVSYLTENPKAQRTAMLEEMLNKIKQGTPKPEQDDSTSANPKRRFARLPLDHSQKTSQSDAESVRDAPFAKDRVHSHNPTIDPNLTLPEPPRNVLARPRHPLNAPSRITPICPPVPELKRFDPSQREVPEPSQDFSIEELGADPIDDLIGEEVEFGDGLVVIITESKADMLKLEGDGFCEWVKAAELL